MGSFEIFSIALTLSAGILSFSAVSSGVGSFPFSWTSSLIVFVILLMDSTIWTGILIVRDWSARALVMDCLTHHVAYVLNLYPLLYSNLSTALIRPILPS